MHDWIDRPTIIVFCHTLRDRREIKRLGMDEQFRFIFHEYATLELERMVSPQHNPLINIESLEAELASIAQRYNREEISGVISTDDYPGAILASVVAEAWGLPGTSPRAALLFQHKYFSRCFQKRFVPEAVPKFELCTTAERLPSLPLPIIVKPVKSFFSVGATRVSDVKEFFASYKKAELPAQFFGPIQDIFEKITDLPFGKSVVLAEEFIEGPQFTLEAFVEHGEFHHVGIVDSIMYPGTQCFQRFEYPSQLPASVQQKMREVARIIVFEAGYTSGFVNVEFIYNHTSGTVKIVEINPRMASQFADLYEKVNGTNSYLTLLNLTIGKPLEKVHAGGSHPCAASCVLRSFSDALVRRVPTDREISLVEQRFPDVRVEILATVGQYLSAELQDGASYRYAVINIGGESRNDILERLDQCISMLPFDLDPSAPMKPFF